MEVENCPKWKEISIGGPISTWMIVGGRVAPKKLN